MWQYYYQPKSLLQALSLLAEYPTARIVAGGTDIMVELRRSIRPTDTLIDISQIDELRYVMLEQGSIRIGALATHNDIIGSPFALRMLPLAQASREIGAPQIRAAATVVGNLVTASPANDTIAALIALDAEIVITSAAHERVIRLSEFYQGVRKTTLHPGEIVREIRFAALRESERGLFLKLGLRRAQAISVINAAIVVSGSDANSDFQVNQACITLGCVAPTIVRCSSAEAYLAGKALDSTTIAEASKLVQESITPIDDIRGSATYRRRIAQVLITDGLTRIAEDRQHEGWEAEQVLLDAKISSRMATQNLASATSPPSAPIEEIRLLLNNQPYALENAHTRTLLDALREEAGITGTKEGCAEGECGACTVWLNGKAIMACLTPAAQAHGAAVTTIEGLAEHGRLHPVQEAFIEHGAVQCGFCTPGFLMAAAKLLEEHPNPSQDQVLTALSGNICRCTGYKQIIAAVINAANRDNNSAILPK